MITACIICKNEEKHIEKCMRSLKKYGIPIVIADTGSTDATVSICRSVLDEDDILCHFDWCDDFSAARNFCARQAKTDWIWAIDADEIVTSFQRDGMEDFFLRYANTPVIGTVSQKDVFADETCAPLEAVTQLGRIYHRRFCHYEGRIHEQIRPVSHDICPYFAVPVTIDHYGYFHRMDLQNKCRRNISLLSEELSALPKQDTEQAPYLYYQLGKSYGILDNYEQAIVCYQKGLSYDLNPKQTYVASMVESYGYALLETRQFEQALSFVGLYDAFCYRADFVFLMALIYMNNGQFDNAIREFQKATTYKSCEITGVNSYLSNYNIGVIYECQGNFEKAAAFYKKCESYLPAQNRLSELGGNT